MRRLRLVFAPLAVLAIGGLTLYTAWPAPARPAPEATDGGFAVGSVYAPVLVSSYADAWVAAARSVEQGGSVADAQKVLQDTWKEARVKAFRADVQPAFSRVLTDGTEPADPAARARVVALWRAFAAGLKGRH